MWLFIVIIVIIILGVIEQFNVERHIYKDSTYFITPSDKPQMFINPYTGNEFIVNISGKYLPEEVYAKFSKKLKPKKLVITQISKPAYKLFSGMTEISRITPVTDFCGLVEPILKTAIRPNLNDFSYIIHTNDNIHCMMFNNKICIFNE